MSLIRPPRIALLGFQLESNSHAPPCEQSEFDVLTGEALASDLRQAAPRAPAEMSGFVDEMTASGAWEAVPVSVAMGGAAGPVEQEFFDQWRSAAIAAVEAAGHCDGIYLAQHGAAISTESEDPDGEFLGALRRLLGKQVPLIATLDPHANVSPEMARAADALIAYRTNPHVDMYERGREAAQAMRRLLACGKVASAFVKIPFVPPSTAQNTKDGPLGEHIAFGQSFIGGDIVAVSVCSGFSLGDTRKNGMSVIVSGTPEAAGTAAREIAMRIWRERSRYRIEMTPVDKAVAQMLTANENSNLPALCFADVADNPGGGGRGNTTYILKAFVEAGCRDVLLAPFFDSELAGEAWDAGLGNTFAARFNRAESNEYSQSMVVQAEVLALHEGLIVGRRGLRAGRTLDMGPTSLIRCDGVSILVTSRRVQFCDPVMAECVGIDLGGLRGLVVKSRGHFRAAIDEYFTDKCIVEVDAPGLTTPMLERVNWQRMPRPIYPLDPSMEWVPQVSTF